MVLKVSVVGKVPCGVGDKLQWDTHSETPGFTSKAMFSAAENYASTSKTKQTSTGHQMTMQPELPIVNWVLSDLPSFKIQQAQHRFTVR